MPFAPALQEVPMLPATTERVRRNTAPKVNDRIRREIYARVAECAEAGPEAIDRRLAELDHEWDIERLLETNAASVSLLGLGLGLCVSRKFLVLPVLVGGYLLQHALHGWCPPVPLLRRLGVRTQSEIECERYALKALRGDFAKVQHGKASPSLVDDVFAAVRR
jgi:hypothetical protein